MDIVCIFGHREESYPGEYAPELIAAQDEYSDDDNPDYLNEEQQKAVDSKEFIFIKRMTITIEDEEFDEAFFPKPISLRARISE